MVLIEDDEKPERHERTFLLGLIPRLWNLIYANVTFSAALALFGVVFLAAYPVGGGQISCRHVLPLLLHVGFIGFCHSLQYSLYQRHFRKRHFELYGVDLDEVEEQERKKKAMLTFKALHGVKGLTDRFENELANSRLGRFLAAQKRKGPQFARLLLHFLWIYEFLAVLVLAFGTWSACGVFGKSVVRSPDSRQDEDVYAGIFGTDRGRFGSEAYSHPPLGVAYDPERELTCCMCPGVYCPYLYDRSNDPINPDCPCYDTQSRLQYERMKLEAERAREIANAAKNGTILAFLPDGTRVYAVNHTFVAEQALLASVVSTTTPQPWDPDNPVDYPAQCSLRYMRKACVGMLCFYGSQQDYEKEVPAECRGPMPNPDNFPTLETITSGVYIPPDASASITTTPEPVFQPPDYSGCRFDDWQPWGACSQACCCGGLSFRVKVASTDPPQSPYCQQAQMNEMRPCNRDVSCVEIQEVINFDLSCEDTRVEYQCETGGYACLRRLRIGHTVMLDFYSDEKGFLELQQRATVTGFRLRQTEPEKFCLRFVEVERNGVRWWYNEESLVHITEFYGEACPVSFQLPGTIVGPQTEPDCPLVRDPLLPVAASQATVTTTPDPRTIYVGMDTQVYDPISKKYRPRAELEAEQASLVGREKKKAGFELLDDCYPFLFVPFVAGLLEVAVKEPCPSNASTKEVALVRVIVGLLGLLQIVLRVYFLYVERQQKSESNSTEVLERKKVIHATVKDGIDLWKMDMTTEEKMLALGYASGGQLFDQMSTTSTRQLAILNDPHSSEGEDADGETQAKSQYLGRILDVTGKKYLPDEQLPKEFRGLRTEHERHARKKLEEKKRRLEYLEKMAPEDRQRLDKMLDEKLYHKMQASFTQYDKRDRFIRTASSAATSSFDVGGFERKLRLQPVLEKDPSTGHYKMVLVDTAPTPPPEEIYPMQKPGEDKVPESFRQWEDEKDFPGSSFMFSPNRTVASEFVAGGATDRSGGSKSKSKSRYGHQVHPEALDDGDTAMSVEDGFAGDTIQDKEDPLEQSIVPPLRDFPGSPPGVQQPLSPGVQPSDTPAGMGLMSKEGQYLLDSVNMQTPAAGNNNMAIVAVEGGQMSRPRDGPPRGRPPETDPKMARGIRLAPVNSMVDRQRREKEELERSATAHLDASFARGVPQTPHSSVASGLLASGSRQAVLTDNVGNRLLSVRLDDPRASRRVCTACTCKIRHKGGQRVQVWIPTTAPNTSDESKQYTLCATCAKQIESLASCWMAQVSAEDQLVMAKMLGKLQGKHYKVEQEEYMIVGSQVLFNGHEIFKLKAKLQSQHAKVDSKLGVEYDPVLTGADKETTADGSLKPPLPEKLRVLRPLLGILTPEGDLVSVEEVKPDGSIVWSDGDEWPVYDEAEKIKEAEEREAARLAAIEEARIQAEFEEYCRKQEAEKAEREARERAAEEARLEKERVEMEKQLMRDKGFDPDDMDEEELEMARKIIYGGGKGGDDDSD